LIVGFLVGIFYAAILMVIFAAASSGPLEGISDLPIDLSAVGPLLLILLPIVFAIGGAVMGTLFGVVVISAYNLIARMVGGIEFVLEPMATQDGNSSAIVLPKQDTVPKFVVPPPPPPPQADPPRGVDTENS
jgi:hypothetical protein